MQEVPGSIPGSARVTFLPFVSVTCVCVCVCVCVVCVCVCVCVKRAEGDFFFGSLEEREIDSCQFAGCPLPFSVHSL